MLKSIVEETPLGGPLAIAILYVGYLLLLSGRLQDPVNSFSLASCTERHALTHVPEAEDILSFCDFECHSKEAARAEVPFRWSGLDRQSVCSGI